MIQYYKKVMLLILILCLSIILILLFPQPWIIKLLSPLICPDAVYFKTTDRPIIALTIDDSPDINTTQKILDILAEHNIVATFFPISNQILKNPSIAKAIVKDGHEIGNHLTEDRPSIQLKENFATELDKAHQTLSKYTTIKWLRPGGGWCDRRMVDIAKKYNYQVALGSVWSYDTNIYNSHFAAWFILVNTRPGSIIVLHDVGKRGEKTAETLKKIIPKLKEKGYRFVILSELNQS